MHLNGEIIVDLNMMTLDLNADLYEGFRCQSKTRSKCILACSLKYTLEGQLECRFKWSFRW